MKLYIIYGFIFVMLLSNIDHTRGGINRTYLRLKFKGMQINQLLFLRGAFVCGAFIWIQVGYGINGMFFLCVFAFVFVFFSLLASLRTRYSYVIKEKFTRIHYHFLNLIFIGLYMQKKAKVVGVERAEKKERLM